MKRLIAACLAATSLSALALASNAKQMVIPGHVAKSNVQEVNRKVRWHTNLNSALARAHREKKMVLWVHMIGKVDGAT